MDNQMLAVSWDELFVGGGASAVNLVIHATLLAVIVRVVAALRHYRMLGPSVIQRTVVIYVAGLLLVMAHYLEVRVWAKTYEWVAAAPPDTPLVYFAFSNYTTLGYGDIIPVPAWRLLGPITALNGILLIGWSTALIYAVLRGTDDAKTAGPLSTEAAQEIKKDVKEAEEEVEREFKKT
ncbi:Ion channel [Methyloligella halotolerans]|uniref:Ion channel n=1 Tax=Methyloligella halotolerans TaxID=1177755 RepID=A0A1E2RWF3_9HYPH|nr:potassium channel family protein [Methyloligella halotolerans]ODA66418.1 Ion channel [Methyloligella halotolerans]